VARHWRPKKHVTCTACGWFGFRVIRAKACPNCGHWHPTETVVAKSAFLAVSDGYNKQVDEIAALRAEVSRLREALELFAWLGVELPGRNPNCVMHLVGFPTGEILCIEYILKARAALSPQEKSNG